MLPNQNGQDVIINFLVNMSQTNKNFDLLSARISNIRGQMKDMAEKVGADWKTIQKSMLETFKAQINAPDSQIPQAQRAAMIKLYSSALSQATTEMAKMQKQEEQFAASTLKAGQAQQTAAKQTITWAGALGKLSVATKIVIGNVLGFTLTGMLRDLVGFFQQAITDAIDLSRSFYVLTEAVNSFRRKGVNITMTDAANTIAEMRQEMGYFNNKELVEGIALTYNLTRNFGFANEQVKNMIKWSAGISIMTGKTFDEAAKQLALFISSGYGEGLQRAGLAVNRLSVAEKARTEGLNKSYMALTELERSEMAYLVIKDQSLDLEKAIADYEKTTPGRLKKIQAETENTTLAIGNKMIVLAEVWAKFKKTVITILNDIIMALSIWAEIILTVTAPAFAFLITNIEALNMAFHGSAPNIKEWSEMFIKNLNVVTGSVSNAMQKYREDINAANQLGAEGPLGPKVVEPTISEEEWTQLEEDLIQLFRDLDEAQQEFTDKSIELEQERTDKLAELRDKFTEDSNEVWKKYYDDLAKLQHELADDITDANEDYQKDLADVDKDEKKSIEDSNKKYHEAVLKEERDFQERMRKLREEFLFDLQDALRQRDALAVLNLIRRYELDKQQATREHENRLQELKDQHKDELEEARKAAAEKREELKQELEQEIADLKEAEAEKAAELAKNRDEELQKIYDDWIEERNATNDEYDKRAKELQDALDAQVKSVFDAFAQQYNDTGKWGTAITTSLRAFFGKEGIAAGIINEYVSTLESAWATSEKYYLDMQAILSDVMKMVEQANQAMASIPGYIDAGFPPVPPQQTGGVMYASSPRTVTFGETPELATFTPLSQIGKLFGGKGGKQKVAIALLLSPDLEARIVDQSMNEFADVMIERTR